MSLSIRHECIHVPVTALASVGPLLLAAEGPYVRFYRGDNFCDIGSRRVFLDQAIHGIAVENTSSRYAVIGVWGGALVRFFRIDMHNDFRESSLDALQLSSTIRLVDWILDLSFGPPDSRSAVDDTRVCAAITSHNALIELSISNKEASNEDQTSCSIETRHKELTAGSRSILYSAHSLWDSSDRILIAAGTAFGEIMFWSWTRKPDSPQRSCIHRVFLGHEGSIFGVRISREFETQDREQKKRFLASCSDDRTIRVWDISGLAASDVVEDDPDIERTRHTGFSNAAFDTDTSSSEYVAIGWGHLSRVWTADFLHSAESNTNVFLLSSGEDATSRIWRFPLRESALSNNGNGEALELSQVDIAAYHNGKNIWSAAVRDPSGMKSRIVCGGADGKITSRNVPNLDANCKPQSKEYSVEDIMLMNTHGKDPVIPERNDVAPRSSKNLEFFRSYAFLGACSFIMTTNSGKVFKETLSQSDGKAGEIMARDSVLLAQVDELAGYSICAADSSVGLAFIAGSRGTVFMYRRDTGNLSKIHSIKGKVGSMFTSCVSSSPDKQRIFLLVTMMGQKEAQLVECHIPTHDEAFVSRTILVPISELLTGLVITSMEYVSTDKNVDYIFLGFRGGSVGLYSITSKSPTADLDHEVAKASIFRIVERVHAKETVTSLLWHPSHINTTCGYLLSVGRDGFCIIHEIDLKSNKIQLVHQLALPFGPNVEGISIKEGRVMVHGFSSTKFIAYDISSEEEILSVETGGSHRSWAYHSALWPEGGGTLVWTRASSMHVFSQATSNHQVICPGGHGREIKTVAVRGPGNDSGSTSQIIATGAEDTDIKLFEYKDSKFRCLRTLRKHTTGIQHLQWSEDGQYLFSSGGCEEFYIWRIRTLPEPLGVSVVCESVCMPDSEHSDLRIMSFDIMKHPLSSCAFIIALIYSNSHIRVYSYDASTAQAWRTLAKGTYFTSCLTQCTFSSPRTVFTAGTDGHAVLWPLEDAIIRAHPSMPTAPATLEWKQPARIHQSASKSLSTLDLNDGVKLLVSGGDDGSLAFLTTAASQTSPTTAPYTAPLTLLVRAHESAVTACTVFTIRTKIYVLSSGNDQWLRLWEVQLGDNRCDKKEEAGIDIARTSKARTNIADVCSMSLLGSSAVGVHVVVCGVGMEVVKVEWTDT